MEQTKTTKTFRVLVTLAKWPLNGMPEANAFIQSAIVIVALICLFGLNGCGLVMCNDENEQVMPCPLGACWRCQ